ncbi:MAG: M4 family metallopeptidase [Polyangia bacterium]
MAAQLLGLIACRPPLPGPSDPPPQLDEARLQQAQDAARAELDRTYGGRIKTRLRPELGTVAFAQAEAGAVPLSGASSPSSALVQWVLRFRALYGVTDASDLDPERTEVDERGLRHVRLRQERRGVPVWGTVLVGHLDSRGSLVALHGRLVPLAAWPLAEPVPTLAPEEIRQLALGLVRSEAPQASVTAGAPSLWYLPVGRRLALAYRVEVSGQLGALPLRMALFLDAHGGTSLAREDLVAALDVTVPATGRGRGALGDERTLALSQRGETYSLEDPTRGGGRTTSLGLGERLPGKTVTSKQPDRWDPAGHAVDVHAHLATLWDYFARAHRRFGWDGKGHGLTAMTLADDVTAPGQPAALALFDGERLLFSGGDKKLVMPLGAALDVVAHEYAHAVVRSAADLAGTGESGALDEGLADLWACLIEQAAGAPTGPDPRAPDGPGAPPAEGAWTVGERIYRPAQGPAALRDLADPRRTGQARTLDELMTDAASPPLSLTDLGLLSALGRSARQHNAGLPAHVGYELAQRIGAQKTAAVVYRAVTLYLHRYADFADAADAMAAAARDLYSPPAVPQGSPAGGPAAASPEVRAVVESWAAAGVRGLGR